MASINVLLLTILLPLLSTTTQNIEKAFLQNNPKILYSLFSSKSSVNISLPEPISFSDQLSNQQAYFLFKKIFSSYTTFEFYSENDAALTSDKKIFIFKARWSFKDNKNNNQHVIHIFFYIIQEKSQANKKKEASWKVIEIKAKKFEYF